jgi:hypothetical protein
VVDTPDGSRSYRRPFIDGLTAAGHEVVLLQTNRDLVEAGLDLRDWRLLHRRCPTIHAAGLIDTLRLARHLNSATSNGLARLVAVHDLTAKIDSLAVGSQPHRALWDTIAAANLLVTLVAQAWPSPPTIDQLIDIAGTPLENTPPAAAADQPSLFER